MLTSLFEMEKKYPQLEIRKYMKWKISLVKDKYMVKAVDQLLKKVVWRLKDK